jgi:hypothetical protein
MIKHKDTLLVIERLNTEGVVGGNASLADECMPVEILYDEVNYEK